MAYITYAQLNSLDEFPLIAGSSYTIEFEAYYTDGSPLDLGGATVEWVLCPYGQVDVNILDIEGTVIDTNKFDIKLTAAQTANLSGKYIHQPIITSFAGRVYKPAQGIILVLPAIKRG